MDVQVKIPSPAADFNFDSACTSPYISAPSSPQHFGNLFFSAPTSPNRASSFYRNFDNFSSHADFTAGASGSLSKVPFTWEEKPGIAKVKSPVEINDDDAEFEFDFSGQLGKVSLSADELFDGGKIRPLKPPPRLQFVESPYDSPKSPRSPRSPMSSRILSPRQRQKDVDPFAVAIEQTRKQTYNRDRDGDRNRNCDRDQRNQQERGREKTYDSLKSSSRKKGARSWSPFRVSDILTETEIKKQDTNCSNPTTTNQSQSQSFSTSSSSSSSFSWRGYKKWRLKDLLLFRSASEGRASDKDPLKKYSMISSEDVKNSSFRSTESVGSVSKRRPPVTSSAHEQHYTAKRAAAEEMKRKTLLPYNRGILWGCLGFNPGLHHDISSRFSSLNRG